eukprot:gene37614-46404_t
MARVATTRSLASATLRPFAVIGYAAHAARRAPKSVGATFFRTDNRPRVCSVNGQPRRPLEGGALELFALAPHPYKINIAAAMIPTPQEVFMLLRNPFAGATVVPDPDDAEYPEMPRNAMQHVLVDFCLPAAELGALLSELALREPGQRSAVPDDVAVEAAVAKRVLSDLEAVESLGQQVPFNCPGCGGVLWQISKSNELRFRCHTGHAYTAAALLAEQTEKMEETMWVALRMFEEHRNLLLRMNAEGSANSSSAERLEQLCLHIQRIRAMLRSTGGWK